MNDQEPIPMGKGRLTGYNFLVPKDSIGVAKIGKWIANHNIDMGIKTSLLYRFFGLELL